MTPEEPIQALLLELREQSKAADDGMQGHYEVNGGNKLGGMSPPADSRQLPFSPERAALIMQLDMADVPFFVDFGDNGVGHLFFDLDSDKGYFMWSGG